MTLRRVISVLCYAVLRDVDKLDSREITLELKNVKVNKRRKNKESKKKEKTDKWI